MPKNGLKWNRKALEQIRNTRESRAYSKELAGDVARAASGGGAVSGYKVTDLVLEDPRSAVSVMATGHARNHNRKHHALVKALGDVRRP